MYDSIAKEFLASIEARLVRKDPSTSGFDTCFAKFGLVDHDGDLTEQGAVYYMAANNASEIYFEGMIAIDKDNSLTVGERLSAKIAVIDEFDNMLDELRATIAYDLAM